MPHLRWALLSIAAAIATIGLKFLAYRLTGSVGIFSDALESLVNLAAAVVLLFALWFASFPPDVTHAYGHEKIEYFSSGFEGALVLFAAFEILRTAIPRLVTPAPIEQLGIGLVLLLVASAINLGVARLLLREARRTDSLALETDGHHLLADVFTSGGVAAGLVVVALTGIERLDALIALVVGALILRTGIDLVRRSFHGLMDRALDPHELEAIRAAIESRLAGGMIFHELRTRRVGPRRLADVHVLVPGEFTVREGHGVATTVEREVLDALPGTEITVHVEPLEGDRGAGHLPGPVVRGEVREGQG
ncbi:MAG: cation transporter [Chloroflexi bacterium]|nr:cation transporter [Chloroflexota bacterium]